MTIVEIIIIALLVVIVLLMLLIFTGMVTIYVKMKEGFSFIGTKIELCESKLGYIKGTSMNIEILLKEIYNPSFEWGKLTQEQQSEFIYRLTHPIVESPFKPPFNPTCETTNKD